MKNSRTYVIALTGPSAAGKTTLGHYLSANFKNEFTHIRQDDYLKDPKTFPVVNGFKDWERPENIKFDVIHNHLLKLKNGESVDWQTFARDEHEKVYHYTHQPNKYLLLDGTMILQVPQIREIADLKIYLDIPLEVSLERRAYRAKHEWGFDLGSHDQVMMVPVIEKHRRVQKFYTDYIIDGTKTKLEVAREVKNLIDAVIKEHENKSTNLTYVSGLWNQSDGTESFSGNF